MVYRLRQVKCMSLSKTPIKNEEHPQGGTIPTGVLRVF